MNGTRSINITEIVMTSDPKVIAAARAWVAECEWQNITADEIADLSASEIVRGVNDAYEGGWHQFVQDGEHA